MIGLTLILLMIIPTLSEVFSINSNYEVSSKPFFDELAHATFEATDRLTGWNSLYISTNPMVTPQEQHRAAGFL